MARSRMKKFGIWSARVLLSLVILFALAIGFGTSGADADKMRVFADAVERWQHNPEFREVQVEYVEMGSDAMRTRACFINTTKGIMWLRSLPGLPEHLRVNDTSLAHYNDFTRGPLSAYMHLTAEQGLGETLKMITYLGSKEKLTDDDIRDFLHQYKLHNPVASDAGAVASVRSLINDVDPSRGFAVEGDVGKNVTPHIASIAQSMGYPANIERMTPAQQLDVWQVLDDEVRETDYELWRTKQVNDWLNGVWAQVYGTMYSGLIGPTLTLREVGRVTGPVMLMGWVGLGLWRRKRDMAAEEARDVPPRLALEGPKDMSEG